MTVLRDPRTGVGQNVTNDGHAEVIAIIESGVEHQSEEAGLSFVWTSTFAANGGEEVIAIQNDDNDRHLHIVQVDVGAAAASSFTLFEVITGTPGGTTITAQNLNLDSGKVAEETSFGDASVTGGLSGNALAVVSVPAADTKQINLHSALILAKNDKIALTQDTTATSVITVIGFYSDLPD